MNHPQVPTDKIMPTQAMMKAAHFQTHPVHLVMFCDAHPTAIHKASASEPFKPLYSRPWHLWAAVVMIIGQRPCRQSFWIVFSFCIRCQWEQRQLSLSLSHSPPNEWKIFYHLLMPMLMESQVKFHSPQNISGVSQQNFRLSVSLS